MELPPLFFLLFSNVFCSTSKGTYHKIFVDGFFLIQLLLSPIDIPSKDLDF